nr:aspartyl/asparaginyl beta-hydroxylase domain-containing protein [Actibacterium sp. 188UL27-1]
MANSWTRIRDELRDFQFGNLTIDREGKTHDQVFTEVTSHIQGGGDYGWIRGWGPDGASDNWTQLGLVICNQPIPFLGNAFPTTLSLLAVIPDIKVAAFVRLGPGGFLTTHRHPELAEEGLLQMHLVLDASETANYAYMNVEGEFRQHAPGTGFVFDGSRDHFAVNASKTDRIILYLEFKPHPAAEA